MDKKLRNKLWRQTPNGMKSGTLSSWRKGKLLDSDNDNYEKIYERYLIATNCELCGVFLEGRGNQKKCMDHNHITELFRNVVCHNCNMKTQTNINIGRSVGITFVKKKQLWCYRKQTDGISHKKMNKNKQNLLWYKFVYLILR